MTYTCTQFNAFEDCGTIYLKVLFIFQYTVAGTNGRNGHHVLPHVDSATKGVLEHVPTLYQLAEVRHVLEI